MPDGSRTMQKYIDEFFDALERNRKGAFLYALFLALLYAAGRFLGPDMESFRKISDRASLELFLSANAGRLLAYAALSFFAGAYAGMGYWGCIMGQVQPGWKDFFSRANRMFFRSLPGYAAEGAMPLLMISGAILAALLMPRLPWISLVFPAFFAFFVWLSFRIIFWEPLMYRVNSNGVEALRTSFYASRGYFAPVFWAVLFPVFLLNMIGGRVSASFLRYSFLLLNSVLVPVAVPVIVFMILKRLPVPPSE